MRVYVLIVPYCPDSFVPLGFPSLPFFPVFFLPKGKLLDEMRGEKKGEELCTADHVVSCPSYTGQPSKQTHEHRLHSPLRTGNRPRVQR